MSDSGFGFKWSVPRSHLHVLLELFNKKLSFFSFFSLFLSLQVDCFYVRDPSGAQFFIFLKYRCLCANERSVENIICHLDHRSSQYNDLRM